MFYKLVATNSRKPAVLGLIGYWGEIRGGIGYPLTFVLDENNAFHKKGTLKTSQIAAIDWENKSQVVVKTASGTTYVFEPFAR